ncbi:MAG: N-formylglutamate amidohydrolase [Salaquimonas sp.]
MAPDQSKQSFTIRKPAISRVPFVFNSPHSGRNYFPGFVASSKLDAKTLRRSEDFKVDELFAGVVPLGAPLLSADFPRAWLDVNREPYELDRKMFTGKLPDFVNDKSARVIGGLGTIAKIVSETQHIYKDKLSVHEGLSRIKENYMPYHAALRGLLAEAVVQFGHGVLVDCHSMPSSATSLSGRVQTKLRADFVLGDRFGQSCSPMITNYAAEFLRDLGYRVEINKPYAGGFITEHYGRPENGLHAIQIEINRALYMDENRIEKSSNFDQLAYDLSKFTARLVSIPDSGLEASIPLAAE